MLYTLCNYICRLPCLLHIQFSLYENYTVISKVCQYIYFNIYTSIYLILAMSQQTVDK